MLAGGSQVAIKPPRPCSKLNLPPRAFAEVKLAVMKQLRGFSSPQKSLRSQFDQVQSILVPPTVQNRTQRISPNFLLLENQGTSPGGRADVSAGQSQV